MSPKFARFLICKVMKWTIVGEPGPENKLIYLAAPHTSIWDFVVGYLYYRALGGHLKTMIKKEAFFFPLGPILRAMGAFPIDRSNPQRMIMSIVHEMDSLQEGKTFHLVICPEGTRSGVHKWKTGYHTIARETGIPVYITFFDYASKRVGIKGKVELTDNARADTDRIQGIYESMKLTALHPDWYFTK